MGIYQSPKIQTLWIKEVKDVAFILDAQIRTNPHVAKNRTRNPRRESLGRLVTARTILFELHGPGIIWRSGSLRSIGRLGRCRRILLALPVRRERWKGGEYPCRKNGANYRTVQPGFHLPLHVGKRNRYTIPVCQMLTLPVEENCLE
jgi:hypothetical protein